MTNFFSQITTGFLLGLSLSATAFGTSVPGADVSGKETPGMDVSHVEVPAPVINPATRWGNGAGTLAPAVLQSILETKLRLAARTAYLQAEGMAYGVNVSAGAQADRDTAAGVFNYLDSRNNYVETLQAQDLTVLPVGIKKALSGGNGTLDIGIMKANFLQDHAELTVFVRLVIPSPDPNSSIKERELFFGADKVSFSRDGGLLGDFRLVLLGDFVQPLGNMTLRFKGGLNRFTTPDVNAQTYATVSCESLAGLGIAADVTFPRSMLVPINEMTGETLSGQVQGTFRIDAPTFNDLLVGVDLVPFAVTGYEKFGFILRRAELDLSDTRNAPSVQFPIDYFGQPGNDQPGGDINHWRGVYIDQFSILLPAEFKNPSTSERLKITATRLLFDRNGITGQISMSTGSNYGVKAGGWAMNLQAFQLAFEKNKLVGGRFGGNLTLPIAPDSPLIYEGIIDKKADYVLSLQTTRQLNFGLWRAQATLHESSRIDLQVLNGEFKPRALLHGRMGIYTNLSGAQLTASSAKIGFEGVVFENLLLQTEKAPYLSATYFGYEGETKVLGFPVSVTRVGVLIPDDTHVGLNFGVKVSLMKDVFSGETSLTLFGKMETQDGIQKWSFDKIGKPIGLCVQGSVSTFTLAGCVETLENDPVYGDCFKGNISLSLSDPSKIKLDGQIQAIFGTKADYRYWFVAGGAGFSPGIPVAGPLKINYLYAAAYHHMKPTRLSGDSSPVVYQPDSDFSLGFKAVAGLEAVREDVFRGSAGLEMTFSKSNGLNSVGFFGEGEMAGKTTPESEPARGIRAATKFSTIVSNSQNQPQQETFTKQDLDRKALTEFKYAQYGYNINGRLALLYDRPNSTLHGDAEVYVNIGGFITGTGPNGRAGSMVLHFDPQEWYVHVGHPNKYQRIGLMAKFGPINARTDGYFMVGHRIPDIPAPPVEVTSHLRNWQVPQRSQEQRDSLKLGKGILFGASTALSWELRLGIPYVRLDALAGFDIMMKSGYYCRPDSYYARGQLYGYLQGEAGVYFFGRRPILTVGTAALLDGGLPKPAWIAGELALYLRLGRIISKTVNFNLSAGPVCR